MIDDYQSALIEAFRHYRPRPNYSVYPSYHEGLYLEDKFFEWFMENGSGIGRYYIPVFWTTCYNDSKTLGLQDLLRRLDPAKEYFTISQHDDAIRESLPPNTICFNAGGNGGGTPIPLVCSPIREEMKMPGLERDIFCSFVGSNTHPIRAFLYNSLSANPKYFFKIGGWSPTVSDEDLRNFIEVTSRSKFALCPRGYGKSSFRLYEVMQLGAIPVFAYDQKWLPFEDEIEWQDFCVLIPLEKLNSVDEILSSISEEKIAEMQSKLQKIWSDNFTMESIFERISKNLIQR